ncbi:MAG TPA: efflux transporter outer membrane subunit [Polyangia bacterium]|jgi:NodT family efflux transporter outer membrane factor (OMF) lipoprotein|nr:efflux transporter outer membrane subunit [Polyangia bacterium]
MLARSERRSVVAMLALAGCAVGPNFVRPEAPRTQAYTSDEHAAATTPSASAQRIETSNRLPPDWWHLLRCPRLDAFVSDALARNPSLDAAEASLRRSEDALRAGYGVFFPGADAAGGISRQRSSPARAASALPPSVFNLFTLSASVSYALDVWGGQRRTIEGLRADVEAQRDALAGAQLLLAAHVVNTVIAEAAYREQRDATLALVALEEDQVRLGRAQAEAGTVPYSSVLGLESQAAATRATLPGLEQKMDQAQHLLATLTGRLPGEWSPPPVTLSDMTLPAAIPVSLPSELVRQRPDILIAEARLHASSAQIGVATAAMLPSFTLSASYGAASLAAANLGADGSRFWSVGAGVTQPVFHGGALHQQRRAAIDARDEASANYRQTVLAAFAQVADGLRAIGHDAETLDAESAALDSAQSALRLVQIDYDAGLANYLQVIVANEQYLQSRLGHIEARAQQLQDTVALFVAVGGGWWNTSDARAR